MTHTIETCGRTLLDTVNHLLDFAKINNFTKNATREGLKRNNSKTNKAELKLPEGATLGLNSDLDLGILVEDVVRSVLAGYKFHHPMVALERERGTNVELNYSVQSNNFLRWSETFSRSSCCCRNWQGERRQCHSRSRPYCELHIPHAERSTAEDSHEPLWKCTQVHEIWVCVCQARLRHQTRRAG